MKSYLTFKTAGVYFACDFDDIIRIEAAAGTTVTPAPAFPEYMPGTYVSDGEVMPVIDTAIRFGLGGGVTGSYSCFIVAKLSEGSMSGHYSRCAALADEVCGSVRLESELNPPPAVNSESFARYVKGTFVSDDVTYYVITPQLLAGE